MRHEPIEFGTVSGGRTKRLASGLASIRRKKNSANGLHSKNVIDEAFADYSQTEIASGGARHWQSASRELIADIAAQLENLDRQRRRLAQLLESVQSGPI